MTIFDTLAITLLTPENLVIIENSKAYNVRASDSKGDKITTILYRIDWSCIALKKATQNIWLLCTVYKLILRRRQRGLNQFSNVPWHKTSQYLLPGLQIHSHLISSVKIKGCLGDGPGKREREREVLMDNCSHQILLFSIVISNRLNLRFEFFKVPAFALYL